MCTKVVKFTQLLRWLLRTVGKGHLYVVLTTVPAPCVHTAQLSECPPLSHEKPRHSPSGTLFH